MSTVSKIALRTRSKLSRLIEVLRGDMNAVDETTADHEARLSNLERPRAGSDLHSSEVQENSRKCEEQDRTERMTDTEFRDDLEHRFGTTEWAKKVIRSIINKERPII